MRRDRSSHDTAATAAPFRLCALCTYETGHGEIIHHHYDDGCEPLVEKMMRVRRERLDELKSPLRARTEGI